MCNVCNVCQHVHTGGKVCLTHVCVSRKAEREGIDEAKRCGKEMRGERPVDRGKDALEEWPHPASVYMCTPPEVMTHVRLPR